MSLNGFLDISSYRIIFISFVVVVVIVVAVVAVVFTRGIEAFESLCSHSSVQAALSQQWTMHLSQQMFLPLWIFW